MNPTLYTIVLDGPLLPGQPLDTLRTNLVRLFKTDPARVDALLGQAPVPIKRELPAEQAERYLQALRLAGAAARKEPERSLTLSLEPRDDAPDATPADARGVLAGRMACPKCQLEQSQAAECTGCGIVIAKFLARQAQLQQMDALAEPASPYAAPRSAVSEPLPAFGPLRVFTTDGRIGRVRYLAWSMAFMLATAGLFGIAAGAMLASNALGLALMGLIALAVVGVSTMIGVQRLHDLGWSGWWLLLNLVPIVGYILPLLMLALPGSRGPNRFGPPPPANSRAVLVLAWSWLAVIVLGLLAGVLLPSYLSGAD